MTIERQRLRRPRRGGPAKAPIRILQSISSGVKKSAKLVGIHGSRRPRTRRRHGHSHGYGSTNARYSRSSRRRNLRRNGSGNMAANRVIIEDDMVHEGSSLVSDEPSLDDRHTSSLRLGQNSHMVGIEMDMGMGTAPQDVQARVLNDLELVLRHAVVLISAYLLGVSQPIKFVKEAVVWSIGKVLGIAWGTCAFIKISTWCMTTEPIEEDERIEDMMESIPLIEDNNVQMIDDDNDMIRRPSSNTGSIKDAASYDYEVGLSRIDADRVTGSPPRELKKGLVKRQPLKFGKRRRKKVSDTDVDLNNANVSDSMVVDVEAGAEMVEAEEVYLPNQPQQDNIQEKPNDPKMPHPELDQIFGFDVTSAERIVPNGEPTFFDNDVVTGCFLPMIRTSDADAKVEPEDTKGTPSNDAISNHFRKKQRRLELQFQMKFKKVPEGKAWFGFEIEDPIKLGPMQKLFVNAALNFVEKKNKGSMHYSLFGNEKASEEDIKNGKNERPHLVIAVESAFDRMVVTKEGEELPKLGGDLYEDPESIKRRKKGSMTFNTSDTYTMALWTAYVDFLDWKVVNLPAIRPFYVTSIIGDQPIFLVLKSLKPESNGEHLECYTNRFMNYEVGHGRKTRIGRARKRWMDKNVECKSPSHHQKLLIPDADSVDDNINNIDDAEDGEALHDLSDSGAEDYADDDYDSSSGFDDETEALEDLGEGLYLKSLDRVALRDFHAEDQDITLTNGGGFATLQVNNGTVVALEKVDTGGKRNGAQHSQSNLIRNGDAVRVQLIDASGSISYLSVYRGSWLKWISRNPRSSGVFTIHTHNVESNQDDSMTVSTNVETQSSFLRLGGSFQLKVKNSGLHVGVVAKNSATYGGRVLGLYKSGMAYTENEKHILDVDSGRISNQMLVPLRLYALMGAQTEVEGMIPRRGSLKTNSVLESCNIDAPAWIEMMHRSKRQVQRVYVIRITKYDDENVHEDILMGQDNSMNLQIRLRTGKDLTPLLRVGISVDPTSIDEPTTSKEKNKKELPGLSLNLSGDSEAMSPTHLDLVASNDSNVQNVYDCSSIDEVSQVDESISDDQSEGSNAFEDSEVLTPKTAKRKKWIKHGVSKVAKGVKTGTIKSGKIVTKSGKIVGKAVSHPFKGHGRNRGYLPEKTLEKRKLRTSTKDHHVAVNRALKTYKKKSPSKRKSRSLTIPNSVMAGQLKPPEQSLRTVGYIISKLSDSDSLESKSQLADLNPISDLDCSFLSGGTVELGVIPEHGTPLGEYIVARALWESHWREEAAVVYDTCIEFYSPLSSKASFSIPFYDIQGIRKVEPCNETYPLVGFPLLVVETAWKCHYLAFCDDKARCHFLDLLRDAVASNEEVFDRDELKAHLWQGFQSLSEEDAAKWANITSGKKSKQRIILNSCRMSFGCDDFDFESSDEDGSISFFVEDLLHKALSISTETLERNPKDFANFLNDTSRLRLLHLDRLDPNSKSTFCICVNLFHCLLQHALLISKTGPPTKKNVGHFMRTHCYEIGGDVFSLAELECCVIRGSMSQAYHPKPPFVVAKSPAHLTYSLSFVDPRINFILNTGNMSHPPEVPVLKPDDFEEQLNLLCTTYMDRNMKIDPPRKQLVLPKVCDVYRNDFDDVNTCLHYCLQYLSEELQNQVIDCIGAENAPTIKYGPACDKFYPTLKAHNNVELVPARNAIQLKYPNLQTENEVGVKEE